MYSDFEHWLLVILSNDAILVVCLITVRCFVLFILSFDLVVFSLNRFVLDGFRILIGITLFWMVFTF